MQINYDPKYNIAYIKFQEKAEQVETIKLSEEINIDLAPNGFLYGIELLNANKILNLSDKGKLIVKNEAWDKSFEIPLAG